MVGPRQFDVFKNPAKSRDGRPYILVLQSDIFGELDTRVVAPLIAARHAKPVPRLHPVFEIEGQSVLLYPTELAIYPARLLRNPVTNMAAARDAILAALDLVFTGI